ncbi:SH3 domain-containing protein [Streptomyces bluensis]|uniref:SH3 domain-containing protein n=1 Tax=Streptomyces bluensis TaxID=33897 RepID=UPI003697E52D
MRIATRIAAVAASTAVLLGGAVVTAPTASAAPAKPCTTEYGKPFPHKVKTKNGVHLRSGPGTKYTSKGLLRNGVKFNEWCYPQGKWSYGRVKSGPNNGKWGWVNIDYLRA